MPLKVTPKDSTIPFFFAGVLVGLSTIVACNLLLPKLKILRKEEPYVYSNEKEAINTQKRKNSEVNLKSSSIVNDTEEVDFENGIYGENIVKNNKTSEQNDVNKDDEDNVLEENYEKNDEEISYIDEQEIEEKDYDEIIDDDYEDNNDEDEDEDDDDDEEIENGYTEESQSLLTLLYSIAEDQARKEGYVHRSIICNNCGEQIKGFRYKCVNCVDYDLCETCESLGVHYITHVFLKIRISIPPLANPRSALLPIFYPGNDFISNKLDEKKLQKLHQKTHFDIVELEAFYDQYKSLSTVEGEEGGITMETFELCLGPLSLEKNLIIERLFRFFDQSHDGIINFEELVSGLSILCKGSLDERIKHAFIGYDLDEDGKLSRKELHKMLTAYFRLSMDLVRDVVKIMEENIMESFDDEASKPVSSVFAAPIPSSNNYQNDEKDKKNMKKNEEDDSISEYEEDFDSSMELNENQEYPSSSGLPKETNEQLKENNDGDFDSNVKEKENVKVVISSDSPTVISNDIDGNIQKTKEINSENKNTNINVDDESNINTNTNINITSSNESQHKKINIQLDTESYTNNQQYTNTNINTDSDTINNDTTINTKTNINTNINNNSNTNTNSNLNSNTNTNISSNTNSNINSATNKILRRNSNKKFNSTNYNTQPMSTLSIPSTSILPKENVNNGINMTSSSSNSTTNTPLQNRHSSILQKINQKHSYEVLRKSKNLPVMEAMSQDTIEEVVNKTFALANAKNMDYLTFEEFQRVAEADITILAWFEALGSVF